MLAAISRELQRKLDVRVSEMVGMDPTSTDTEWDRHAEVHVATGSKGILRVQVKLGARRPYFKAQGTVRTT